MKIVKNKKIFLGSLVIILFFVIFLVNFNSVAAFEKSASSYLDEIGQKTNVGQKVDKDNNKITPAVMVWRILNRGLGLLGVIGLIIILYSGIQWMTAGGAEESVTQARATLKWAIIGMIVVMSAYAISSYVIDKVINATINAPARPDIPLEDDGPEILDYVDNCQSVNCSLYTTWQSCTSVVMYGTNLACCSWDSIDPDEPNFGTCY